MQKHCMDCGTLLRGRSDKKFCDDHCRVHHNNKVNREARLFINEVNKALKKNKGILERLYLQEKSTFLESALLAAGFDFTFFTHQEYGDEGETYIFCYEYGYLKLNGEVKLKKDTR